MPRTERKCNSILSIALQDAKASYSPGDIIVGQVTHHTSLVRGEAVITLTLCGRAKTRLVFRSGEHSKVRRSRFRLVDETQTRQVLHSGPLEANSGSTAGHQTITVPFAVDVPTHVSRKALLWGDDEESYLPLDEGSVAGQGLPSSVTAPSRHHRLEAFVEYFLEAKLTGAKSGFKILETATLPIVIRNHADGPPIAHFQPRLWPQPCTVSSPRLRPGMEGTKLSTRDSLKMIFSPDKLPNFVFRLDVGVPTIIQLDNPEPVSLTLRAVPNWGSTSEDIKGVPQKIKLTSVHLRIESKSVGLAHGHLFGRYEQNSDVRLDVPLNQALFPLLPAQRKTLFIPCTDEWPPLDIGRELNLRLGHAGPSIGEPRRPGLNGYGEDRLCPTTETYNFKVSHTISWEIRVDVAGGEECKARGSQPILILPSAVGQSEAFYTAPPPLEHLPRSESWIRPPAEDDAPPPFEQVQREDMMRKGAQTEGTNLGERSGM